MKTSPSELLNSLVYETYVSRFGRVPDVLVHAPGRINLIGEHTDYNHGYVLPGAIAQGIWFAIGLRDDRDHHWYAMDTDLVISLPVSVDSPSDRGWADYFLGAYRFLVEKHGLTHAINCVFTSDLPAGAGLSSSSALTCGFLLALDTLYGFGNSRADLAWAAHLVEHDFIGLQGGIMDQHACLLCEQDHLLLLDCLDRSYKQILYPSDNGPHILLIDTRVKHKLTETEYNTRASECLRAFELLRSTMGISSLRDVIHADLDEHYDLLGPILYKRIAFVLAENARVLHAIHMIDRSLWGELGQLLHESHSGLRDDYQVSCAELDFLVDAVTSYEGVYGARMMGGGFGGCTINLLSQASDAQFEMHIRSQFRERFGHDCSFLGVSLSPGASVFKP